MSWVQINENNAIKGEGIMGVKQLEDGSTEVRYITGEHRVLKGVAAEEVMSKITLMKVNESKPDSA